MSYFLLGWNARRFDFDLEGAKRRLESGKCIRWSCGNTTKIHKGDHAFMLRQGLEPRGVFGHGEIVSEVHVDAHWELPRKLARYVKVRLEILMDPKFDGILPHKELVRRYPEVHWTPQASGTRIPERVGRDLELRLSRLERDSLRFSEEDEVSSPEGRQLRRQHLTRERDPRLVAAKKERARRLTGELTCEVCGFDFEERYGDIGAGFMECHHILPLAQTRRTRVTQLDDLALVCANCHRMLHRRLGEMTILKLRQILRATAQ